MICAKCQKEFSTWVIINGRKHNLCSRKYCLECSPFKEGNTRKLHLPQTELSPHSRRWKDLSREEKDLLNQKTYKSQKKRLKHLKQELVNSLGGKCQKCGYNKTLAALCFHHKNPATKLFELNRRNYYSFHMEDILKEVKKCELLCLNCHSEIHFPD